jgi:hypothetical protein
LKSTALIQGTLKSLSAAKSQFSSDIPTTYLFGSASEISSAKSMALITTPSTSSTCAKWDDSKAEMTRKELAVLSLIEANRNFNVTESEEKISSIKDSKMAYKLNSDYYSIESLQALSELKLAIRVQTNTLEKAHENENAIRIRYLSCKVSLQEAWDKLVALRSYLLKFRAKLQDIVIEEISSSCLTSSEPISKESIKELSDLIERDILKSSSDNIRAIDSVTGNFNNNAAEEDFQNYSNESANKLSSIESIRNLIRLRESLKIGVVIAEEKVSMIRKELQKKTDSLMSFDSKIYAHKQESSNLGHGHGHGLANIYSNSHYSMNEMTIQDNSTVFLSSSSFLNPVPYLSTTQDNHGNNTIFTMKSAFQVPNDYSLISSRNATNLDHNHTSQDFSNYKVNKCLFSGYCSSLTSISPKKHFI